MKPIITLLFIFSFSSSFAGGDIDPFVITITTTPRNQADTNTLFKYDLPTTEYEYSYDVDWDYNGVFEADEVDVNGILEHDYGNPGEYTIAIKGIFPKFGSSRPDHIDQLVSIDQWGDIVWKSFESSFRGQYDIRPASYIVNATDIPDLSMVNSLSEMFFISSQANPDVTGWDTSNVTDMSFMFSVTDAANPNVSGWDTSNVTDMSFMFSFADAANPNVSGWDTSNVTDMSGMFFDSAIANPDVSLWDTSNVTDMSFMFSFADAANPDVSGWDTSNVTKMGDMFAIARLANPDVSGWDTSNVTDMTRMFYGADAANPDVSLWDTSNVTDMTRMFFGAILATPDVSLWDTSNVADMNELFAYAGSANPDLRNWVIENVNSMNDMFNSNKMKRSNYEAALISFATQFTNNNVNFAAGSSLYCSSAAENAKTFLTGPTKNWTIVDGSDGLPSCDINDVSVSIESNRSLLAPGGMVTYHISIKNDGDRDIDDLNVITNTMLLTNLNWGCEAVSATCQDSAGNGPILHSSTINSGGEITYIINATNAGMNGEYAMISITAQSIDTPDDFLRDNTATLNSRTSDDIIFYNSLD